MKFAILGLAAALLIAAPATAASIPAAVISDPAPDKANPPRSAQVLVPSGGSEMNALFYLAGGAGPRPTLVLLHGLPGNEQNLDLAQAVRRAGWNVLTLHYRGSWGSQGTFSLANAAEDAVAALTFVRRPEVAAKYGIDTRRLVIGGHSMGGFAAAYAARADKDIAGLVMIDAWNIGPYQRLAADPAERAGFAAGFDDLGHSLQGATGESMVAEIASRGEGWDVIAWAPQLARHPVLTIDAETGNAKENAAVDAAIRANPGARLTAIDMPTDHSFSDHRIALAGAVVDWLNALPAK